MTFSATTVINQLGGSRFVAMTGANSFRTSNNSVTFKIPKATSSIKWVKITLDANDTYTMTFLNRSGKVLREESGLYASDLQGEFTRNTGLVTHL